MHTWNSNLAYENVRRNLHHNLNDVVNICHGLASEAGWWKGVHLPVADKLVICQKLLLVITEIAEATEGLRKDLMDDKLPHRKMVDVELADAMIRICDLAGAMGLDLGGAVVEKLVYNASRADHKPENREKQGGKSF